MKAVIRHCAKSGVSDTTAVALRQTLLDHSQLLGLGSGGGAGAGGGAPQQELVSSPLEAEIRASLLKTAAEQVCTQRSIGYSGYRAFSNQSWRAFVCNEVEVALRTGGSSSFPASTQAKAWSQLK